MIGPHDYLKLANLEDSPKNWTEYNLAVLLRMLLRKRFAMSVKGTPGIEGKPETYSNEYSFKEAFEASDPVLNGNEKVLLEALRAHALELDGRL